ncbi:MAG: VCBS repeat-containing protein, partial [Phycisphaerales bacterium]|nr:VCBS repeat-containing protein [Phycisphaerales bacterium]
MATPFRFTPSSDGLPDTGQWKCHPIFADFNEDGHMDMAAIPRLGKGVRAWTGDGKGNWTESSNGLELDHRSCGGGVDFADVNNDGHLDICVGDHCQGVYVYLGDGAGSWLQVVGQLYPEEVAPEGRKELYRGTEDIATGDIDSDGDV